MIKLTIQVSDINSVIALYDMIKIYTSDSETGLYTYLNALTLQNGVSTYYYLDLNGTSDTWYRSTYYNSTTEAESSMSNAVHGIGPVLYHTATYPPEFDFSAEESAIIRKIRRLIGDLKDLDRIYSDDADFCTAITDDGRSVELNERGWPLYISIDNLEYTELTDPVVNGYKYITFSGSLVSGTSNAKIDVWYHTFKFSDREIYEAYGDAMIPPNVPTDCVTQDHLILQAAINLLESMTADDMLTDGASIRDDQSVYDPSPGLRVRNELIQQLRSDLNGLINECIKKNMLGLEGVLLD